MVADEVKQVLTLCIPLRRQRTDKVEDTEEGGDTKAASTLLISLYLHDHTHQQTASEENHLQSPFKYKNSSTSEASSSEKSKWAPGQKKKIRILIFHSPQERHVRVIKYSYVGSSHLWKAGNVSEAKENKKQQERELLATNFICDYLSQWTEREDSDRRLDLHQPATWTQNCYDTHTHIVLHTFPLAHKPIFYLAIHNYITE